MTEPRQPADPQIPATPAQPSGDAAAVRPSPNAATAPTTPKAATAADALAAKLGMMLNSSDFAEHDIALINRITGEMDMLCRLQPDGSIICD